MNNGALHFNALLTTRDFETGIKRLENQIKGISNTTQQETSKIDGYFKNLSAGIGAYFSANMLQGFVQELVNVRGEFQKTEIAFGTMLQSKEKAKELMGQMVDLAAKTPFSLKDVSEGAKQLLAFQVPANELVDTLRRMGDVASALGVPISRINLVYGQVRAKGRLMGDDLRQFTEAGIPMVAELAKQFNKTTAEITDMVSAGKIGFTDVQKVLFNLTNEGGLFYNMMEQQAQSLSGKTERLKDAWEQMLNKIGENNEGILYKGIEGLTSLVENYEEVIKVLTILVATYGAYRAALIATNVIQSINATSTAIATWISLARSIRTAKDAQALFNLTASANPYGAILAVLGLLITSYIAYGDEIKEVIGLTEKANAQMRLQEQIDQKLTDTFSKGVTEKRSKIQELIFILDNENTTLEERKRAYEQLIKIDASFIGTLDNQYRYTIRLGEAFDEVVRKMQNFALEQAKLAAVKDIIEKNAQDELNFSIAKTKVKQIDPNFNKKAKEQGLDVEKNPSLYYDAIWSLSYHGKITNDQRDKLLDLTKSYKDYGNAVKESREELAVANKVQKEALYQYNKEYNEILAREKNGWKTAEGKKYTEKFIAQMLQRKQELERLNSSFATTKENTTPTPLNSTKEDKKPKPKKAPSQKDTAIAGSLGAYEEQLSKVQETLKNKTLATDKERVKALLEQEKELQEKIKEIKEQYAQRTFDEELAEIQRQVNLRDKYLQAGYSKESMDNLFPKVKDKTYLGYLEQTQKRLKDLLETGKGNQETAEQLDRVNKAIDEFTAKKNYIEGIQETIENLSTQFSGAELIDKLKKIKNLNANETEQESQEKNNLIDKTIEQEEQKMKQAYQRFLQEHKSFEERRLEITKRYALLKAQAETDAEAKKKIEKAEAKEKSELELDFFKESGDWGLAFSNLEYLGQSTIERLIQSLEEFKKAKAETLQPTELKELNAVIENLRAKANRNPLKGLVDGFKEFSSSKKKIKQAHVEYNDALDKFGKNSDEAKEKQKELTEAELESAKARQKILDGLNKTQEIFNAIGDGVMNIADAFGGLDDASKDAVEDIMAIGNAALDLGKSIASGDVAGMIKAGIQLIGNIFKALSGDKKRERNIKRQQQALKNLENSYKSLEHATKKAIGAAKYDGQRDLIKNLEQQKIALQQMINTESSKKKKDQGKINEWKSQIQEINRSIDDLKTGIIEDVLQTDLAGMAEKVGDALVDAFSRGEDSVKSLKEAANDMLKSILKNQLNLALQNRLKPVMDNLIKQLGFDEKGNGNFKMPTQEQIADFKNQVANAGKGMQHFLEATREIWQGDGLQVDSLKGAIKGMSEETAGVLAGQFNAIRINTGELVKNSAFSLEAMKNAVGHLIKIEENTFNLHQMRKDLAELNSKVKGDKDFRANGF